MLFSSSKCPLPALVMWCRTLHHSLGGRPRPGADLQAAGQVRPASAARRRRRRGREARRRASRSKTPSSRTENRFPPLFLELVAVGEQTGRLEDTFRELERYYESTLTIQRNFRSQMAYPAIQFVLAVLIIGGLDLDPRDAGRVREGDHDRPDRPRASPAPAGRDHVHGDRLRDRRRDSVRAEAHRRTT